MLRKLTEEVEGLTALDGASRQAAGWVARATRSDAVKNALSGTWLGHQLHPMLTDIPIGAWTMASVLDLTAGSAGAASARRLVGIGLIASGPAAWTGASDWSDTYGATQRVGLVHALLNVTASAVQASSWIARRRGRRGLGIALTGAGLCVTACSAYLGGHLSLSRGVGVNHTAFQPAVEDWTDVAAVSDIGDGEPLRVTAVGVPVVLVRHEGVLYALSATCTHAGGPLDEGRIVDDGCIRCPWHGSVFRLTDGKVTRGPAAVDEPRWEVKTDGGRVHVRSATD
ncbi:Rieske 2Fe-2S domain-containing protein [Streptomyces sp. NPDC058067]|uniref:Rieske 2Fe-2S domain-containing protein n=1 Tax=Streptomyces sp. NPDC058067 TaxID=3346324 RepID=UPI0036E0E1C4